LGKLLLLDHFAPSFAHLFVVTNWSNDPMSTTFDTEISRCGETKRTALTLSIVGVAVVGAGSYLYKLSQGPEVVWDRSGDWKPWDRVKYDQNVSLAR